MVVGGMGVPSLITMTVMATMTGSPKEHRTLGCHAPGDTECRPENGAAFKATMGKKAMVPQGNPEHRDDVERNRQNQIQRRQSAIPKQPSSAENGQPRYDNGNNGGDSFGALRRTRGCRDG